MRPILQYYKIIASRDARGEDTCEVRLLSQAIDGNNEDTVFAAI